MTDDTLKITFGQADDHRRAARERLQRAEAGESGDAIEQDARFVLNFEEFGDVEQLMRTSNLELLDAIISEQPESIRQAAMAVDRDYKEVHRNLQELESLGVIEFTREGTSKKPILRGGAETIDVSFRMKGHGEIGDRSGASA
ncbi:transcriptional regulator [Halorarum halobium]|uniref:HVO_A0114 family putative DNA-binding protein n=1 Tax=Halorarum halobium TaxID=3075121 RepID=UPI0028AD04DA|nr:transcriptional regulator [Halobaculum sp. XH14]